MQILNKVMKYDQIVVCTYNAYTYSSQVDLIKRINRLKKRSTCYTKPQSL